MKKTIVAATTTVLLSTAYATMASADTHRVEPGESLWSISKKYNVQITDLKQWNRLKQDLIFPNQSLVVKASSLSAKPISPPPSKANTNKISDKVKSTPAAKKVYKVKAGDSLSKIAKEQGINLKDLLEWNNITSHLIFPGQTLVITKPSLNQPAEKPKAPSPKPAVSPPPAGEKYRVQSGDTLSGISLKLNVSIQDLKSWNSLKSDMIYVGQELKLMKKSTNVQKPVSKSDPAPSTNQLGTVMDSAISLLGTPYLWGGNTPEGFDCSGFIYYVFDQAGQSISRHSSEGYYNRSYYVNTPQIGDLVFFENTYKKGISHLGIYAGDNQFIHASDFGVTKTSLSDPYWKSKFDGFKRLY